MEYANTAHLAATIVVLLPVTVQHVLSLPCKDIQHYIQVLAILVRILTVFGVLMMLIHVVIAKMDGHLLEEETVNLVQWRVVLYVILIYILAKAVKLVMDIVEVVAMSVIKQTVTNVLLIQVFAKSVQLDLELLQMGLAFDVMMKLVPNVQRTI